MLQEVFDDDKFDFSIKETGKQEYNFNVLSSGYAAVLDIMLDLMLRMEKRNSREFIFEQTGIVLIDEIETHLHLELQKRILPMLTRVFPNIQFIVTTHSPFVLNSISNVVIYDLERSLLVEDGLVNMPYEGVVEGYFQADKLSMELKQKFERYKLLAYKERLEDIDIEAQKINGSYREADVIKWLSEDFHEKCYICEMKGISDPQVEYLLPHKNGIYEERKFDWNNLFWACLHCNGVKNKDKYDTGIIDCCKEDPEKYINFIFEKGKATAYAKDVHHKQSVLTAELVDEVFNDNRTGLMDYRAQFRMKKLNEEMNCLYRNLEQLRENPSSQLVLRKLKVLLKREFAFAAYKRGYVKRHLQEYPLLEKYMN